MSANDELSEGVVAFSEHEHRELARGLNQLHATACGVGVTPAPETLQHVGHALAWFTREVEPHLAWEESWLFPRIEELAGTPWATRPARFDHQQIREVAAGLQRQEHSPAARITPATQADLRCALFSLEALLRAHIEREERFIIPVLAELAPARRTAAPVP